MFKLSERAFVLFGSRLSWCNLVSDANDSRVHEGNKEYRRRAAQFSATFGGHCFK
jgi:hypothetical protein